MSNTYIENAIISNYNLNVNFNNMTTYSSGMMFDTYVGNITINGLNANSQQHVVKPIMFGPRNIDMTSYIELC